MRLTANELAREAAATGFQTEPLEKVILLLELLEAIRSHPFLKERVALKGGTALNLFRFDVPRLSVDIDLNYIGAVDREGMLADRPKIEQALHAVCGRVGVQRRRVPSDHAGGKWRLKTQMHSCAC
jgi:predicted nucleotidyltransferase component of viral defense system